MEEGVRQQLAGAGRAYETIIEFLVNYGFQLFGGLIIFLAGLYLARKCSDLAGRLCEKKGMDVTLRTYVRHVIYLLVLACFTIIALGKIGISVTPFVAAIGALSLGAGLALQGLLSNYGAGIAIIIGRPFRVGDTITIQQISGVVREIRLACTVVHTSDGEEILVPNRHIVGEVIHNSFANRLVESVIGVHYRDDPQTAIHAIRDALAELAFVSQDPPPQVGVSAFTENSIQVGVRFWVPTEEYHKCMYEANLAIYRAVVREGLAVPHPQLDLHVQKNGE